MSIFGSVWLLVLADKVPRNASQLWAGFVQSGTVGWSGSLSPVDIDLSENGLRKGPFMTVKSRLHLGWSISM